MDDVPTPVPGLVIRYNYLWRYQQRAGDESGRKPRPAVIIGIATAEGPNDPIRVAVLPITHTPQIEDNAIPLPRATARRLGLDNQQMWIVTTEVNLFRWPGFDLEPVPDRKLRTPAYGHLPQNLTEALRERLAATHQSRTITAVSRDPEYQAASQRRRKRQRMRR